MLGKSRKHKSVKRKSSRRSNKRSRSRKSSRKSSRNYLGLLKGMDEYVKLDENVHRARNMGWSNWSGNADEENAMRKELNEKFLKPLIGNGKNDEDLLVSRELAHLQALRYKSNSKKSVVDDTEDIEDDIYYSMTPGVFYSIANNYTKNDSTFLEELNGADAGLFLSNVVKNANGGSFFSSKKSRGPDIRDMEASKRIKDAEIKKLYLTL